MYVTRKGESIPRNVQSTFLRRLSELLKEGYTFHVAVSMLLPFYVKKSDAVIQKMMKVHKNGLSVTEVFKLIGLSNRLLLPINLASIHGKLQETISFLSVQAAVAEKAQKRLNTLLMYPLFLFTIIFFLFTVFRVYFLPNMQSLLDTRKTIDSDNPIIWTNILLQLPNYFFISMFLIVIFITVVVYRVKMKNASTQLRFYERLPIVRTWNRLFLTRVFSREIGNLLGSGIPLQQAFDALIMQEQNKMLQFVSFQMKDKIIHGESFSNSILLLNYFTSDFHQFVIHGENSGHLSKELILYSEYLTERIEELLSKYLSVLQPALFFILAIFIVGAYLAILLPIYGMINII